MTKPPSADIHAHFYPQPFLDLIEREGARFGASIIRTNPRGPIVDVAGSRTPPLKASFTDLELRRKEMDRQGVRLQALSLTSPMVYWADGEFGGRLARAFNNAIAEAHKAHPDRFVGLLTLPMQDPKLALEELERGAGLSGVAGVYLGTNVRGRELSTSDFFPVYARMEALNLPLLLHPLDVLGGPRLKDFYLSNLLGNPFDNAVAAAHLIFGGVLDRFPKLKVCLPHAGGAFPYLVGRLSRGWKVRPECQHLKRSPTAYLRRFWYDTITHAPEALRYLVGLVGADRVMIGSDYCFDMGYERPVEIVTRLSGLGRADQARVLGGNATRFLRLR